MLSLLRLYWPLCQLQRGPQDLPADPALLLRNILLCLLLGVLSFSVNQSGADAVLRTLISLGLSLACWTLLLRFLAKPGRQLQTLTAIYGCAVIINVLLLPVGWLLDAAGDHPGFLPWLLLGMMVWSQVINGNILRHALDWPLWGGVALALAVFFLRLQLFALIFR